MIGMGSAATPEALQRELADVPPGTRFGIGLVDWVVRRHPGLLQIALEARPALLAVSFGDDRDWIAAAHDAGIMTAVQVFDQRSIAAADTAGADLLVARGQEAGGHGPPLHDRDTVLASAREHTDRPVLAAGAIATIDDVEHVLALGAAGMWVGTALAACEEALSTPCERQALFLARSEDTVVTSVLDQVAGYPWPPEIPERVVATDLVRQWERSGVTDLRTAAAELRDAIDSDDPRRRPVNAGLGVDHLTRQLSAAEIVRQLTPACYQRRRT